MSLGLQLTQRGSQKPNFSLKFCGQLDNPQLWISCSYFQNVLGVAVQFRLLLLQFLRRRLRFRDLLLSLTY